MPAEAFSGLGNSKRGRTSRTAAATADLRKQLPVVRRRGVERAARAPGVGHCASYTATHLGLRTSPSPPKEALSRLAAAPAPRHLLTCASHSPACCWARRPRGHTPSVPGRSGAFPGFAWAACVRTRVVGGRSPRCGAGGAHTRPPRRARFCVDVCFHFSGVRGSEALVFRAPQDEETRPRCAFVPLGAACLDRSCSCPSLAPLGVAGTRWSSGALLGGPAQRP